MKERRNFGKKEGRKKEGRKKEEKKEGRKKEEKKEVTKENFLAILSKLLALVMHYVFTWCTTLTDLEENDVIQLRKMRKYF